MTALGPLQYHKQLRRVEARQLVLAEPTSTAAGVAFQVGYESASQLSRESARRFGSPPVSDAKRIAAEAR